MLGLAGEQDPDQRAGRLSVLTVLTVAGGGCRGGLRSLRRLVLPIGQDSSVLAGVLSVLAAVLVAAVGQRSRNRCQANGAQIGGTPYTRATSSRGGGSRAM
jgi:hypothetical protein